MWNMPNPSTRTLVIMLAVSLVSLAVLLWGHYVFGWH